MYKVTEINGVKTYNMSAGKSHSQFLAEAKKNSKSLRYDEEYRRRIELVQDFQFEVSTNQVEISRD
jgi:ribosome biogenesis protein ENP2